MKTISDFQKQYGLMDFEFAGYEICRQKDFLFNHTGIIVGASIFTGEIGVIHSHPHSNGVDFVWIHEFANGEEVFYTNSVPNDRLECIKRAFSLLEQGHSYRPFDNCQHFSSYCLYGDAKSVAVENATDILFWGGLLTAAIGAATGNKTATKIGAIAAGTGVVGKIAQSVIQEKKKTEREVKFYIAMKVVQSRVEDNVFKFKTNFK